MNLIEFHRRLIREPRQQDHLRLTGYGYKVYSQNDEDGILAEIFSRVGTGARNFVEFGVERGTECNSIWLLMQGWRGLWIEGASENCEFIRCEHCHWLENGQLSLVNAYITAENINKLIGSRYNGVEIDLLSIDIDYNDFWVWKAIDVVLPRVVVIEYNATWRPPAAIAVPYDANKVWMGDNYFGASLSAMAFLGESKRYSLVGCSLSGVNAFFVRHDLLRDKFLNPGVVQEHYEPARYWISQIPSGHKARIGPVVQVGNCSIEDGPA